MTIFLKKFQWETGLDKNFRFFNLTTPPSCGIAEIPIE
jgi:hypothetical protein